MRPEPFHPTSSQVRRTWSDRTDGMSWPLGEQTMCRLYRNSGRRLEIAHKLFLSSKPGSHARQPGSPSAAPFDFAQDKLRTGVGAASARENNFTFELWVISRRRVLLLF